MKNKLSFKQKYVGAWNYIKESRKFIYIIIFFFLIFALIGFFIPAPESITQEIVKLLEELIEKTKGMNFLELSWFIFFNNLKVSFMGMILGIFIGIFPILTSISNGYLLGFVSSFVSDQNGFLSLWKIFPHGIFELSAVFISLGLGVRLGMFIFEKKKIKYIKSNLFNSLRVFFYIIIPLLIIAAIIEAIFIFLMR